MQPVAAPPPWLMFVVMFVAISGFIVLLFIIKAATTGVRRLTDPNVQARARSAAVRAVRDAATAVRERSPQQNAENTPVQGVQAFEDRSAANAATLAISADMPMNITELQQLAHMIALYAKRPNKEVAILEATGFTKGEGDGYQRYSRLFDTAMSDAARQAAKAKGPQITREVEAA